MLEDVHPHWRFEKPIPLSVNAINPLLQINNPETVRPRGHPPGAENRRQQAFEASTNREPSQFERVEMDTAEIVDQAIERVIQRADTTPGRGRRGRRGGRGSQSIRGSQGVRGSRSGRGSRSSRGSRIETTRVQRRRNTGQAADQVQD